MRSRDQRFPLLLVLGAMALAPASGLAQARGAPPPPGDYWQSCQNITTFGYGRDAMMTGQCKDRFGRYQSTSLKFGSCSSVVNLNGQLTCGSLTPGGGNGGGGRGSTLSLYRYANHDGHLIDTTREYSNLPRQYNDMAISLKISGRGNWEVCADANFRGNCQTFDRDVPDLRRYGLGETISSVRPVESHGGYPPPPPPPPAPPWNGGGQHGGTSLNLYSVVGFSGQAFEARMNYSNLPRVHNDQAQSLRINGRGAWEVCADSDFRGHCETFDRDVADLRRFGLSLSISSVRQVR
ncbi:MAG: hypothetical protein CFE28_12165 [Alphaproteobacteria bacterium PA2]|nr:MAG: hypothetical protein CFE28_12165 [Alphaproteobacteria bacterium PA2]